MNGERCAGDGDGTVSAADGEELVTLDVSALLSAVSRSVAEMADAEAE